MKPVWKVPSGRALSSRLWLLAMALFSRTAKDVIGVVGITCAQSTASDVLSERVRLSGGQRSSQHSRCELKLAGSRTRKEKVVELGPADLVYWMLVSAALLL